MANAAVIEGKSCVGVVVGPCPFFLVVLLLLRRNASLAGGFAGRLVVWWWFNFCDLICLFSVQANCAYVPFLSPLMSLSGPCHSAITANHEEKKSTVSIFLGRSSFFSFAPRLSYSSQIVDKMWHQKWVRHRAPFLEPCGRSETRFTGIGGPKFGPPKTQIETQNWCQFLSPSFDTICLPRDAISKYINQSSVPG